MKDTNNLLDYNVWSGTDYANDITGIYINGNATAESNNTFSVNGESSLKITNTDVSRWNSVDLFRISSPKRVVSGKFRIYNPECDVVVNLFHTTEGVLISQVTVPQNKVPREISISGDTSNISGYISIRIFPRDINNSPVYIDDVSLS